MKQSTPFIQHISELRPKKIDNAAYREQITSLVDMMLSLSINNAQLTILEYIQMFVHHVLTHSSDPRLRSKVSNFNMLFADLEWTIDTTIKANRYERKQTSTQKEQKPLQETIKENVVQYALTLSLDDAINFMGELAGAWILSCSTSELESDHDVRQMALGWAENNEDYIYILRYQLQLGLEVWR